MTEIKIYFKAHAKFIGLIEEGSLLTYGDKISNIYAYNMNKESLYLHHNIITNSDSPTRTEESRLRELRRNGFDYSISKLKKIDPSKIYLVNGIENFNISNSLNRLNLSLIELDPQNKWETNERAVLETTLKTHPLGANKTVLQIPRTMKSSYGNIVDITLSNRIDKSRDFIFEQDEELLEIEFELAIISLAMPEKAVVKYSTLSDDSVRNLDYLCEVEIEQKKINQHIAKQKNISIIKEKAKPYLDLGLDEKFAIAIAKGGNGKEIVKLWQSDWWQQYSTDDQLIQAVLKNKITNEGAQYLNSIRSDFHELVSACLSGKVSIDWVKAILSAGFNESPEGVKAILDGGDPEVIAMLLKLKINVSLLPPALN